MPLLLVLTAFPATAQNCGWSRVDHRVRYDASGIWNPHVYRGIVGALTVAQIGGAVWEGAKLRFGKSMLYVGTGRIKNQAHWQTDVLMGWAVGGLSGWYAHSRDVPLLIQVLPHGFEVGYRKQF